MGTHVSFMFRGYNYPYIGGSKPSFFMVLGSKGVVKSGIFPKFPAKQ